MVNLKTAARMLGVHYQTAYRYVRSGELVAVKVGGSYNISLGAVELLRQRLAVMDSPALSVHHELPPADDDIGAELDTLIGGVMLTAQPVLDAVTRWLAVSVGDIGVLRLISEDGAFAPVVSLFDADPATRPIVEAFLGSWVMRTDEGLARLTISEDRPTMEHHLPALQSFISVPPRFLSYAELLVLQSFVAVPLKSPAGRVIGSLLVARRHGAPPLPDDVVGILERLAAKVVQALARAERFSAAWVARDSLHESIEALLAIDPTVDLDAVSDTLFDLLDDSLAEAVFDLSGEVVAANAAFADRCRIGSEHLDKCGCSYILDGVSFEKAWSRLLATGDFPAGGEDSCVSCGFAGGLHWAMVRRPDATPVGVVAVGVAPSDPPDCVESADSASDVRTQGRRRASDRTDA